ncbi:MAG: hypothetical protein ACXV95_04115 [Acidimicrobiales bacterium]
MASEDPKCPDCDGPIGADWDWCMHCGYDPDHLKPWDWRPASNQSGSVQTATAPGKVDLIDLTERKRRPKRAERAKRKGRSRKGEHPEPKVATMATTSSLITLPARPSAPTGPSARTAPMPPAPGRTASPAPAPPSALSPVAPSPAARQPEGARPAAAPAPTRPAPAPASPRPAATEPAVPKFDMTSPLQTRAYAPTTPPVPTRIISLPRSPLGLVPSIVLYVLAALMLFVALSSMVKLGEGSILSRATTVLFVLVCLALASGMAAQGYTFMKVRVEVGGTEIVAHNRFGRPSRARIRDIFSITMGSRRYLDVPLLGRAVEAPYVQMQDGSGFWLDALEGRAGEPPTPEQLAVVDALARTVAANRSEALNDETGTGLV